RFPLTQEALADPLLNPGGGYVSRLCFEPGVGYEVLMNMMAPDLDSGRLRILTGWKAASVEMRGDRASSVTLKRTTDNESCVIHADFILDATELGDLLPLTGTEYVSGAESQAETGEPHARAGAADPEDVQSLTWCFPLAYEPEKE